MSMNDTTLLSHPPQQEMETVRIPSPGDHSTLADRLSLRLGLWLLLSSARRSARREESLDRARIREHARVVQQYERDAAHTQLLLATRSWR
jgi:hypothetical protein